jgi:DNA-binding NtrC family response regulator
MAEQPARDTTAPAVLIVDDERQIVELLTLYLGQQGFRAFGAETTEAAIGMVRADPTIGVVVTDLRMPGLSGPALAAEMLRGRTEAEAIEVVIITGAGQADPALEGFRDQAFEVLRKPFRPSEVAGAVTRARAACERRRQAAGAPSGASRDAAPLSAEDRARRLAAVLLGLRVTLQPLLSTAEALASGPLPQETELRIQVRCIRDAARELQAMLDDAKATLGPNDCV